MKNLFFAATLAILVSMVSCNKAPVLVDGNTPSPGGAQPSPSPTPQAGSLEAIKDLASGSACGKVSFGGGQGQPPKSYLKGIALSYARAVCNPSSPAVLIASGQVGSASKDALALYGLNPLTPVARLQYVYSLMVGSAALESSWRWCVGKDPAAKETDVNGCANPGASGSTCEAGLYQTSYNSGSANSVLPDLFAQFRKSTAGCFSSDYKGSTTCSSANMKNWGSDPNAVEFQRLSKDCPGFASEYHAVMLRVQRTHYGPINKKQAEIHNECTAMFSDVYHYVTDHPGVCQFL